MQIFYLHLNRIKLYFLLINFLSLCSCYVYFPVYSFRKKNEPEEYGNVQDFVEYYLYNNIYTKFEILSPNGKRQSIITYFSNDNSDFKITEKSCFYHLLDYSEEFKGDKFYSENDAVFKNISRFYLEFVLGIDYFMIEQNVVLYNDIQDRGKFRVEKMKLLFGQREKLNKTSSSSFSCASIGLSLFTTVYTSNRKPSLPVNLKLNNITSDYSYMIYLLNDTFGYYLIGEKPYDLVKNIGKFKEQQEMSVEGLTYDYSYYLKLDFHEIFSSFDENNVFYSSKNDRDRYSTVGFDYTLNVIYGMYTYFKKIEEVFFKEFIDREECFKMTGQHPYKLYQKFKVIFCDKRKVDIQKLKKIPKLIFRHKILMYDFELDYNDLFYENGNYLYFLVVENGFHYGWTLGTPFLKKYLLIFNEDKKTITFFNDKLKTLDDNNTSFSLLNILKLIVFIILILIISFLTARKLYMFKHKKIQADELEENNYNKY